MTSISELTAGRFFEFRRVCGDILSTLFREVHVPLPMVSLHPWLSAGVSLGVLQLVVFVPESDLNRKPLPPFYYTRDTIEA